MSTSITCPQLYYKAPNEVRSIQVDMRGVLREGEICTGTPTVTVSGPTTSAAAVNTTVALVNGQAVEAGKAVTFTISGGTDATDYMVLVSCATSGGQTVNTYCQLSVRVPTFSNP